jgi:HD-like signal output (HDOD) protein
MKRIMFVDDEPNLLDGFRTILRKQRKEWQMTFLTSGQAALAELRTAPYDVIVSDMRMPQMDGATLLRRVKEEHPEIVRIVLSGQTEHEVSRRLVHIAHQFLSKPCDGPELQKSIERACSLQTLLQQPALRRSVGQIEQLPIKPRLYDQLVQILEDPNSSIDSAVALIEKDIGTSSKILQVVNSAFFGLPQRVGDIKTAVSYLGLETVKMLALSVEMRHAHENLKPVAGFSLDAMQDHGLLSARIAKRLLTDRTRGQDAFSAAMLADAGVLVLMTGLRDVFEGIVANALGTRRPFWQCELEVLGVTHAEIGAYLLGIWGLPYSIVEAVAHHHAPARAGSTSLDVVTAVHVGAALADELLPSDPALHLGAGMVLDLEHLAKLGLLEQVPAWREMARQQLSGSQSPP